jgi:peptidylprolyl isomerase
MSTVKNGDFVQLHYTGTLDDGTVFDSSDGRPPLEFQVGGGGIIPGFNDAVIDMAIDEEKKVVLAPDQAYGHPKEDLKRDFPASMLEGHPVEVGQELRFSSPHGPVSGKVLSIEPEKFVVDFNHPLAGQTLTFKVKIVGISDTPTQAQGGCSCTPSSSCSSGCDSCG